MGLFGAIQQIADTAGSVPPPGDPSDAEAVRHSRYHRRIVSVGGCFAALGVVLGLFASVVGAGDVQSLKEVKGVILAPVMLGAGGFVFGMALMCLVAPRAFLTGPAGRPWMKMIGTESVAVARTACLLFGLAITAPFVGVGLVIALGK